MSFIIIIMIKNIYIYIYIYIYMCVYMCVCVCVCVCCLRVRFLSCSGYIYSPTASTGNSHVIFSLQPSTNGLQVYT